jgi:hypothetical protein
MMFDGGCGSERDVLEHVTEMRPHDSGRLIVHMRDGTTILASRARSRELRCEAVSSVRSDEIAPGRAARLDSRRVSHLTSDL